MIKKLYEDHFLEIDSLLTKEQKRLKLTPNELVVLKTLFQSYKRPIFSVSGIAKKIELTDDAIGNAVDKLEEKNFLKIKLETIKGKETEVFDLSPTFNKITELYQTDLREINLKQEEGKIATTIGLFENILNRTLSSTELELIKSWYESMLYPHESIISKIEEYRESGRFSIKFIERSLNAQKLKQVPIDDETDRAIDKIFKAIK